MMAISLKIDTSGFVGMTKRDQNKVQKEVLHAIGLRWHRVFRPHHFTAQGAKKYKYEKRQGQGGNRNSSKWKRSYTGQKFRKYRHTRPLVKTGESMRRTEVEDIRATSKRVRVVMNAPTLNYRKHSTSPDMRTEMTTVTPSELRTLAGYGEKVLEKKYKEFNKTTKERVT